VTVLACRLHLILVLQWAKEEGLAEKFSREINQQVLDFVAMNGTSIFKHKCRFIYIYKKSREFIFIYHSGFRSPIFFLLSVFISIIFKFFF